MGFSRIWPGGVPVDSTLTSSQIDQLDQDHANAARSDNHADTISAQWTMAGTFSADFQSGSTVTLESGSLWTVKSGAGIEIKGTAGLFFDPGIWPGFSATRTRNLIYATSDLPKAGSDNAGTSGYATVSIGETMAWSFPGHDGCALDTVDVYFAVDTGHSTLTGLVPPSLLVQRKSYPVGSTQLIQPLNSGGAQSFMLGTLGQYNDGNIKKMTFTVNQFGNIDRTTYAYHVFVTHESGAPAIAAANYMAIGLNFKNIQDMRFP